LWCIVRWLVISPHFDDAVLSCGHWLHRHPGTVVVTVCSGSPGPGVPASSGWDALAGFQNADEAVDARRAEDIAALTTLGAEQRLLGYVDAPYRSAEEETSFEDDLCQSIADVLDDVRPSLCLIPLGLLHVDHISTGRAARRALRNHPECIAITYAELPNAVLNRVVVDERIAQIQSEGTILKRDVQATSSDDHRAKLRALEYYGTQLRLFDQLFPSWRGALQSDSEHLWRWTPPREPSESRLMMVSAPPR
jgi:LmbE family N-acetylglucosaminyl deacetylase